MKITIISLIISGVLVFSCAFYLDVLLRIDNNQLVDNLVCSAFINFFLSGFFSMMADYKSS